MSREPVRSWRHLRPKPVPEQVHAETSAATTSVIGRSAGITKSGVTSALFFGSGFAALLYQIAWQRMLFGWYGVDLDSISVIVSIFMLGLGVGALAGGWLADRFQHYRIFVFSIIE